MKQIFCTLLLTAASLPLSAETRWAGDFNQDGKLTIADVTLLVQKLAARTPLTVEEKLVADVDGNGTFDKADVLYLSEIVLGKREPRSVGEYIPVDNDKKDHPFD